MPAPDQSASAGRRSDHSGEWVNPGVGGADPGWTRSEAALGADAAPISGQSAGSALARTGLAIVVWPHQAIARELAVRY
jgi:hypothetical protein